MPKTPAPPRASRVRLLLDECIGDRSLRDAFIAAGHDVVRTIDELGGGVDDPAVFSFAREHQRIIVTYNNADFKALAEANPDHSGMLLIYQDSKSSDMTSPDIVKAIANVEATYPDGIAGQLVFLNSFRW